MGATEGHRRFHLVQLRCSRTSANPMDLKTRVAEDRVAPSHELRSRSVRGLALLEATIRLTHFGWGFFNRPTSHHTVHP